MNSLIVKRSIVINGHKTSVSLEEPFWRGLKDIAADQHMHLSTMVADIDTRRRHGNLSSTLRLFVLDRVRTQASARSGAPVGANGMNGGGLQDTSQSIRE